MKVLDIYRKKAPTVLVVECSLYITALNQNNSSWLCFLLLKGRGESVGFKIDCDKRIVSLGLRSFLNRRHIMDKKTFATMIIIYTIRMARLSVVIGNLLEHYIGLLAYVHS